jgi:riboflavin synthase
MFTGIVEETGVVRRFERAARAWRLEIEANAVCADVAQGDSIAVNGCCLTVVDCSKHSLAFDLLEESVRLTNFGDIQPGGRVNLERSLRFDGKVGGHFVSGHIDAIGMLRTFEQRGADTYAVVVPPPEFLKYLVYKGSVAIDGISLTVAEVLADAFAVWLIPHTLQVTNLGARCAGQQLNLEFDLLAKYVERLLPHK